MKCHRISNSVRYPWMASSLSSLWNSLFNSDGRRLAPTKFVTLSKNISEQIYLRLVNYFSALRKAWVVKLHTNLIYMAGLQSHKIDTTYRKGMARIYPFFGLVAHDWLFSFRFGFKTVYAFVKYLSSHITPVYRPKTFSHIGKHCHWTAIHYFCMRITKY